MKYRLFFAVFFLFTSFAFSQNEKVKLYNPEANAKSDIEAAVALADSTGKNVLLQIGGNWCPWCIKFNKFCKTDSEIDTLIRNNFVVVHLNYSSENKNLDILESLDYPQRFGFPVFVVLNGKGTRLHTQDSALLEKGDSYDKPKVTSFFRNWTSNALSPDNYKK